MSAEVEKRLQANDFLALVNEDCRDCIVPRDVIRAAIKKGGDKDSAEAAINRFNTRSKRTCIGSSVIEGLVYCGETQMAIPPPGMTPEQIDQAVEEGV